MMKESNTREKYLDIAKGIGIILVVWAHAKGPYERYIYQFHMPLFFMISGFLHNDRNTVRQFIKRKIKSIYIPFVTWNLAVIVLKTLKNPAMIKRNMILACQVLLALNKDGQFFGATWFLGALFFVSIAYKIFDESVGDYPWKRWLITACFLAAGAVAFKITFPFMFSRTLILSMFYAIGYFVRCYKKELTVFNRNGFAAAACWGIFVAIAHYNSANMGANKYRYPAAFVVGALAAAYAVIFFSREIEKKQNVWLIRRIQEVLCYLGAKSIHIVIWQFVAFRIVIAVQLLLHGESLSHILNYYPVYDASGYWWLIYTVTGLVIPIFWGNMLDGIVVKIKHRYKEIS